MTGVDGRELLRAQRLLESRWVRRSESMEGQASYLADWQALGDCRTRRSVPRACAGSDAG